MLQSMQVPLEGLDDERRAFLNPLEPLRTVPGMTFDEAKFQIDWNISYGIQKLAPVGRARRVWLRRFFFSQKGKKKMNK